MLERTRRTIEGNVLSFEVPETVQWLPPVHWLKVIVALDHVCTLFLVARWSTRRALWACNGNVNVTTVLF